MSTIHFRHRETPGWIIAGLCVSSTGELLACGQFDPNEWPGVPVKIGDSGRILRIGTGLKYSNSLCFDPLDGRLIVAGNDGSDSRRRNDAPTGIFSLQPTGSLVTVTRVGISGLSLPVAVDRGHNIYYPGAIDGTKGQGLLRINADGEIAQVADEFAQITGLAVTEDGNLIVADAEASANQGTLLKVNLSDHTIEILVHERDIRPLSVAIANDGSIYFSSITGSNGDVGIVYKRNLNRDVIPYVTGLVQPRIAYNAVNDELIVANFLNFECGRSTIPVEFHNDIRLLRFRAPGVESDPYVQSSATIPADTAPVAAFCESPAAAAEEPSEGNAADLATRIKAQRKRLQSFLPPQFFTEEAIDRLIHLAFNASLEPEEGRYPKFRIIAGTNARIRSQVELCSTRFPSGVEVADVETLRRLAPAATSQSAALYFGEHFHGGKEGLRCYGICDSQELLIFRPSGNDPIDEREFLQSPAFVLKVEGPGRIKAGILPGQIHLLKGGSIRTLNPLESVPVIDAWFKELGGWQHNRLSIRNEQRLRTLFDRELFAQLMTNLWSQILWQVADRRHGGAFLVLPVNHGHWRHPHQFKIDCKFRGSFHLGDAFFDFVDFCLQNTPTQGESHLYIFDLFWHRWKGDLARMVPLIADLSNVDGCVVVDRRLQVLGFGGKIEYRPTKSSGAGTRHLSAQSWCKDFPEGIAIVISQDGDVTVFCGDDKSGPLDVGSSVVQIA